MCTLFVWVNISLYNIRTFESGYSSALNIYTVVWFDFNTYQERYVSGLDELFLLLIDGHLII